MVKIADLFGQGENFLSSVRFFGCVCGLWLLIVIFFKRALVDVRWLFWNSVLVFVDVLVACSLDIWLVLCFVDLCLFVCLFTGYLSSFSERVRARFDNWQLDLVVYSHELITNSQSIWK